MSITSSRLTLLASARLEAIVPLYFAAHAGYIVLTRLATEGQPAGLALLPYSLLAYAVFTAVFIWLSGWYRDANHGGVSGWQIPRPTRETVLSGIGSAMMLTSIPIAYSFTDVSVALALLLLRGGALAIAPMVDLLHRRRIFWHSGVALALVAAALLLALRAREGAALPIPAILTLGLYNLGFLLRLTMMTRIAKRGDDAQTRGYFVEEKLVALPLACVALAAIMVAGTSTPGASPGAALQVDWSVPLMAGVLGMGMALAASSVLTSIILLNSRENSFCVPLERATSLLGGMGAAWLLHWVWHLQAPATGEMQGAALLLLAIVVLTVRRRPGPDTAA
jgi:hypothetical protein